MEEALEGFDGTLLVISHDRYFLDRIVDRIVEAAGVVAEALILLRRLEGGLRPLKGRGS